MECYKLPNGDRIGPDASVVLGTRWNALTSAHQDEAYAPVAPNFVVKLRSASDSAAYVHRRMLCWMNGGTQEAWSIDRFSNPPVVNIYMVANQQIFMQTLTNPPRIRSTILNGFVMTMRNIL
ncbi:unnamed protein product [Rhizophagus irregularis]|nr:unnamed protein product [Rhizophagus irregularis]